MRSFICVSVGALCLAMLSGCNSPQSNVRTCAATMLTESNAKNWQAVVTTSTDCINGPGQMPTVMAIYYRVRAQAEFNLHSYAAAAADYEKAAALAPPHNGWDMIMLSASYRESGHPDKAIKTLNQMHDANLGEAGSGTGFHMPYYYHLGRAQIAARQPAAAVASFDTGILFQPDYASVYFYRALAQDMLGRKAEAKADLDKYLELISALPSVELQDQKMPQAKLLAKYGLQFPDNVK